MNTVENKLLARTKATRCMLKHKIAHNVFKMLPDNMQALRGTLDITGEITTTLDIAFSAIIKACMLDNMPHKYGKDAYKLFVLNKY